MHTSLADHRAAIDQATQEHERARSRHELAERVASEFKSYLQRVRAAMDAAPADCDPLRQRLQFVLASASQELFEVVQSEQDRVIDAERLLARTRESLRRAERASTKSRP